MDSADSYIHHRLPHTPANTFRGQHIISDQVGKDELSVVWPRLSPGGAVLIDGYNHPELPGVAQAVADFFSSQPMPPLQLQHDIAIIKR